MKTPTYELRIAASCSMGRPAYFHDIRQTHTDNVNTDLSKNNVILVDELKGRTIDEYLDELLQPSIDECNEKQKRKGRKINMSYTDYHKLNDNKGEMVYEFVMQYGEHEDLGKMYFEGSPEVQQKLKEQFIKVYTKWLQDWQEQHPNQKILWATIHFDENGGDQKKNVGGTPHLHLAVAPLSSDFKKGPKTQISMSKSLESDGFKRMDTKKEGYQLARAFEKFRETQETDLRQLGYEIKKRKGGKHLDCEQYREVMTEATQAAQQITEEAKKIEVLTEDLKRTEEIERAPVYDPSKVKTIQHKESILSKSEELIAMDKDTFDGLVADAAARKVAKDAEYKIKRQNMILDKFMENVTRSDRELSLERENAALKKQLEEKDLQLSEITTKYERLKIQITDFLKQFKQFNLIKKFADYLRSWQQEWHKPEFTTPTQERKEREL